MKKILCFEAFILFACLCVGTSCGKGAPGEKAGRSEANPIAFKGSPVELIRQVVERYNSKDISGLVSLFAKDVEWVHNTATRTTVRGRTQLAKHLMRERSRFPDCEIAVKRILDFGDMLVVEGVFRATHKGVAQGVAASGKKVSYELVYVATVEGNEVVRNMAYFNPALPLRQLGAIVVESAPIPEWPASPEIVKNTPNPNNEDLVKQFYAAWEANNFDELGGLLSERSRAVDRALVSTETGLNGFQDLLKRKRKIYEGFRYETEGIRSAGDYVVARVTMKGSRTMIPDGAEKPEARVVAAPEVHVFKIASGKVEEFAYYYDELHEYQQFGYTMAGALIALGNNSTQNQPETVRNRDGNGEESPDVGRLK